MTKNTPSPTAHAPHCDAPDYEWQQPIWPNLARRGRCRNCGATRIDRTGTDRRDGMT